MDEVMPGLDASNPTLTIPAGLLQARNYRFQVNTKVQGGQHISSDIIDVFVSSPDDLSKLPPLEFGASFIFTLPRAPQTVADIWPDIDTSFLHAVINKTGVSPDHIATKCTQVCPYQRSELEADGRRVCQPFPRRLSITSIPAQSHEHHAAGENQHHDGENNNQYDDDVDEKAILSADAMKLLFGSRRMRQRVTHTVDGDENHLDDVPVTESGYQTISNDEQNDHWDHSDDVSVIESGYQTLSNDEQNDQGDHHDDFNDTVSARRILSDVSTSSSFMYLVEYKIWLSRLASDEMHIIVQESLNDFAASGLAEMLLEHFLILRPEFRPSPISENNVFDDSDDNSNNNNNVFIPGRDEFDDGSETIDGWVLVVICSVVVSAGLFSLVGGWLYLARRRGRAEAEARIQAEKMVQRQGAMKRRASEASITQKLFSDHHTHSHSSL